MIKNNMSVAIDTTKFTPLQTERMNAIHHIYGEDSALYIPHLKPRGENSWKQFYDKAVEVNKARGELGDYFAMLTTEFSRFPVLPESKIQQIVCEVRADMALGPYFKQIKAQALKDFYKLFLFEEHYDESDDDLKGPFLGYRPLIAIKAQ